MPPPLADDHTETTLKAELDKAFGKGYAARLDATGLVSYVTSDQIPGEVSGLFSKAVDETKSAYESRIDVLLNGGIANRIGVKVLDSSDLLGLLGFKDMPVHLVESKVVAGMSNHGLTG
jgi:hypothetical protein